jgi:hypothetical protein
MVVSADMNREPFFSPPQPQLKKKKKTLSLLSLNMEEQYG